MDISHMAKSVQRAQRQVELAEKELEEKQAQVELAKNRLNAAEKLLSDEATALFEAVPSLAKTLQNFLDQHRVKVGTPEVKFTKDTMSEGTIRTGNVILTPDSMIKTYRQKCGCVYRGEYKTDGNWTDELLFRCWVHGG